MSARCRARGWIHYCFTVSFSQRGRHKGAAEERWALLGERPQRDEPPRFVLPPPAPPQSILRHAGTGAVGRFKEQRKLGTKLTCEIAGRAKDANQRVKYSVAACLKEISVNNLRSYYKLRSLFLI